MVNPITGPYVTNLNTAGYVLEQASYRQKRPYNLNLAFSKGEGWEINSPHDPPNNAWRFRGFAYGMDSTHVYAKAYDKLVGKLGEQAGLGVTLAQWKQADDMIRKRARQLTSFTVSLARRSPVGVAASLGLSLRDVRAIMRTRYGVARSLSDLWLEFWFGWKPMVSDIYTACEVFDQDLPWGRYKAVSEIKDYRTVTMQQPSSPFSEGIASNYTRIRVSLGVDVRLKNPNVHLLNQFGLLNPGLVAWDVIPWSFVLGWFANVDSWLRSFTDFAGLETGNAYVKTTKEMLARTYWPAYPSKGGRGFGRSIQRQTLASLPRPTLGWKSLSLKPTRALTAITLLVQKLPRQ